MIRNLLWNRENNRATAVIDGGKYISYDELMKKADLLICTLRGLRSERVAVFLNDGSEYIAALFGVFASGKAAFPINCSMTVYEITSLIKQSDTHTVISSRIFSSLFDKLTAKHIPDLQVIYVEELKRDGSADHCKTALSPDAPLVLINTSGSTGMPAIVQLSEKNIEASAYGYLDKMKFEKSDAEHVRYLLTTPLTSAYGLMILFACLIKSFPIIILKNGLTLTSFYKAVHQHKATHCEGGAAVLLMMKQTADKKLPYDISSMEYYGFGGSKISGRALKMVSTAFPHIHFSQGYGMTEAAPLISKNAGREKPDSVGTAIMGMEIEVNADGNITTRPFEQGEIVVKGANVMIGYYKDEKKTKAVLKNGYLYTGDIGYLDKEGYLYICGRMKNIIIVRGFNVYPEEVENCLMDSRMIKDCLVYGEMDSSGNECVCADVVAIDSQCQADAIMSYCHRHLSGYKKPQKLRMVAEIKKTSAGKKERGVKYGFDTL